MSAEQLKQTYLALPEEFRKELSLFAEFLAQKHKAQSQTTKLLLANLDLPEYTQKLNLSEYAISEDTLSGLKDLWKDELDAESLCKLLTP